MQILQLARWKLDATLHCADCLVSLLHCSLKRITISAMPNTICAVEQLMLQGTVDSIGLVGHSVGVSICC